MTEGRGGGEGFCSGREASGVSDPSCLHKTGVWKDGSAAVKSSTDFSGEGGFSYQHPHDDLHFFCNYSSRGFSGRFCLHKHSMPVVIDIHAGETLLHIKSKAKQNCKHWEQIIL